MYYSVFIIRTQIQLKEEQYRHLHRRAAENHQSVAQQIREAIDLYLKQKYSSSPKKISDIAGKFKPLPMNDLPDHDRWMVEAILDSKSRED